MYVDAVSLQHGHMLLNFIIWPVSVLHTNIVFQNVSSMCRKPDQLREMLETNVVGVHAMVQGFMPLLQSGKRKTVVNISTAMASQNTWYHQVKDLSVSE